MKKNMENIEKNMKNEKNMKKNMENNIFKH
jgi:hypothetical protein